MGYHYICFSIIRSRSSLICRVVHIAACRIDKHQRDIFLPASGRKWAQPALAPRRADMAVLELNLN